MWNQRYAKETYVYGTEPNAFLAQNAERLSGPVLCLAEGEGRNAVFLASLGLEVVGVDGSSVGLAKAQKLAAERGVVIQTQVADLESYELPENFYGAVVSIFAHVPSATRKRLHRLVERALKPGGIVLLEAYTKAQAARQTGGPRDPDLLMAQEDIENEFPNCERLLSQEIERPIHEGEAHAGMGAVLQFLAKKKS
jgi:cyclopropane fatty-acyl-phospholipid synthase-like methyltransferase